MTWCLGNVLAIKCGMCVQGRQLALTLHRVFEALSSFCSNDDNSTVEVASFISLLNVVWDVSCSCREAGYPESSMKELDQTWGNGTQHLLRAAVPDGHPDQVPGCCEVCRLCGPAVPQAVGRAGVARPSRKGGYRREQRERPLLLCRLGDVSGRAVVSILSRWPLSCCCAFLLLLGRRAVVLQPRLRQPGGAQRAGTQDACVRRGLRGAVLQP